MSAQPCRTCGSTRRNRTVVPGPEAERETVLVDCGGCEVRLYSYNRRRRDYPGVDRAIEAFRKKLTVDLGDPDNATGRCILYSDEFATFARARGLQARVISGGASEFYPNRPVRGHANHCLVRIGRYRIDWTASQYGFPEVPKVTGG